MRFTLHYNIYRQMHPNLIGWAFINLCVGWWWWEGTQLAPIREGFTQRYSKLKRSRCVMAEQDICCISYIQYRHTATCRMPHSAIMGRRSGTLQGVHYGRDNTVRHSKLQT